MKVLGLITEYNPFHLGHLYHLKESKRLSGAQGVVCVMSGNWIQRGEPAIINKWARAKAALKSGIDLVIELPTVYAMSSAEYFAFGGVQLLDSLGITDSLCFGSEAGELEGLCKIASLLAEEPAGYQTLLKAQLSTGHSYPAAREAAVRMYFKKQSGGDEEMASLLGTANNILGIEYLKALKRLGSRIRPMTLRRVRNAYHSTRLTGTISSATAIRNSILSSSGTKLEEVRHTVPERIFNILEEEFSSGRGPLSMKDFEGILLSLFRRMDPQAVKALAGVAEGLENRICSAAQEAGSIEALLDRICTKRYTKTRIQRTLLHGLTGLTAEELETFQKYGGPQYIRVLGFNAIGRELLSEINQKARLPVIMKTADFKSSCNPLLRRMLEIEAISTDMYVLGYKNPEHRKAGQEFTQNIIKETVSKY